MCTIDVDLFIYFFFLVRKWCMNSNKWMKMVAKQGRATQKLKGLICLAYLTHIATWAAIVVKLTILRVSP
jgi:hypothetical protein